MVKAQEAFHYDFQNVTLDFALHELELNYNIRIYLLDEWIEGIRINDQANANSVYELLSQLLSKHGFAVLQYDATSYVLLRQIEDGQIIEQYAPDGEVIQRIVVGEAIPGNKQGVISGVISDIENDEALVGATVQVRELKLGTTTDINGRYELTLPVGEHILEINSLGYHKDLAHLIIQSDGVIDRTMVSASSTLNEVVVTARKEQVAISEGQMSQNIVEMDKIEYIPSLMGEKDIVKVIELLPGVNATGEGSNGYSVRGGNAGQNLILVENAPLYNASHLFGLFSIFNPGVVDNAVIYKGTMPIQYGGRVSSVMDVNLKDGKGDEWNGEAGIGLMSSRLHLEGPLSEKLSFVAGGRVSYVNRYLDNLENFNVRGSQAGFYDVSAKIAYELSDKNSFDLSGMLSQDDFTLPSGDRITYGNKLLSANWSHVFSDDAISHFSFGFSNYDSNIFSGDSIAEKKVANEITTYLLKGSLSWFKIENHSVTAGVETGFTTINPGTITTSNTQENTKQQIQRERGLESAVFVSDEYVLNDDFTFNLGLRYSNFIMIGTGKSYDYTPNAPRRGSTVIDSANYSSGEIIQSYGGFEPRFFVNYTIDNSTSLKFNVGRSRQYLHLISNSASVSPLNIWKLSDTYLKPQIADQAALGLFKNVGRQAIELSGEIFYRKTQNLPDYKNGAVLLENPHLERDLVSGKGRAYGFEFQAAKKNGLLTGWVAYTYSRSFNKMNSVIFEEKINRGAVYSSSNDIPHVLSVSGDYNMKRRWSLSFNWMYNSGRPITYPVAVYYQGDIPVAYFSDRNKYRMPDYHRLDLSLNWKGASLKIDKKWDLDWVFSVYNVYGRANAYSIFFERESYKIVGKKLSVLADPIPSVTIVAKF